VSLAGKGCPCVGEEAGLCAGEAATHGRLVGEMQRAPGGGHCSAGALCGNRRRPGSLECGRQGEESDR